MHSVIHIGMHKAGSTSIQLALSRGRARLGAQGILYPAQSNLGPEKFVCHHRLASQLNGFGTFYIDDELLGPNLSQLRQAIDETNPAYLVLSSEVFSDTSMGRDLEASHLVRLLESRCKSICAVCVVRPQAEMLQSAYIEGVKSFSYFRSFAQYRQEAISMPFFDYVERLAPWSNCRAFSFAAVPLNKSVDAARLTQTVLIAGGIPEGVVKAAGIPDTERINQDPGAMTVAALRRVIPKMHELQREPGRSRIMQWIYQEAKSRGWTKTHFHGYTAEEFDSIGEHFRERNSQFANSHWGKPWDEVFENEAFRSREPTEVELDDLPNNVLVELDEFGLKLQNFVTHLRSERKPMAQNTKVHGTNLDSQAPAPPSAGPEDASQTVPPSSNESDYSWARDLPDEEWIEFLAGERNIAGHTAPAMPDPAIQRRYVGAEGASALKEAAIFCRNMRAILKEFGVSWGPKSRVLDFGVGWGRIYRLLAREIDPQRFIGVDVDPITLDVFRKTIPWGTCAQIPPEPPYKFLTHTFDTIYMYSIFSHLNADAIVLILNEFARILQPNGFVFFTTLREEHINVWARQATEEGPVAERLKLAGFDVGKWTRKLHEDGLLHLPPVPNKDSRTPPSYGLTILTETFLKRKSIEREFDIVQFEEPKDMRQSFVALRRR